MSQRQLLRGKGSQLPMQGMLVRWTKSAGIGTILGRDARAYAVTAPVLRRSSIVSTVSLGKGKGKDGKQSDVLVDDAISEDGRVWEFTADEVDDANRMPEINAIWKGIATGITPDQWRSITGTAGKGNTASRRPRESRETSQENGAGKGKGETCMPGNAGAQTVARITWERERGGGSGGGDRRPVARTGGGKQSPPTFIRQDDMPDAEEMSGRRCRSRDRGRGKREDSQAGKQGNPEASEAGSNGSQGIVKSEQEMTLFVEMEEWLATIGLDGWALELDADGWEKMEDLKLIREKDLAALPGRMPRGHIRRLLTALEKLA
eukprot:gene2138-5003_t